MRPEILIVGGGIAGIQAALTYAKSGKKVYLVEQQASIGGHMAELDKTFPTLDCSACILTPKMSEVGKASEHRAPDLERSRGDLGLYRKFQGENPEESPLRRHRQMQRLRRLLGELPDDRDAFGTDHPQRKNDHQTRRIRRRPPHETQGHPSAFFKPILISGTEIQLEKDIASACGSDLMSDVLAFGRSGQVLLTGLTNAQSIRTANIIEAKAVVYVRGKRPNDEGLGTGQAQGHSRSSPRAA